MNNTLAKTPANFRAEIARFEIVQADLAALISMNTTHLSNLLHENVVMYEWAANNIAWGINRLSGSHLFVTKKRGLVPARRGRPKRIDKYPLLPHGEASGAHRVPGGF